jgi:multidrug transporter EmrE-like cation transporter
VNLFLAIHSEKLYNTCIMNASLLKTILVIFFMLMYLISFSYLSQRKMKKIAFALWGTFALLLPGFGPFFVIAYRPGEWNEKKHRIRFIPKSKR